MADSQIQAVEGVEEKASKIIVNKKKPTPHYFHEVNDALDYIGVMEGFGDKIAFSYYGADRQIKDLSFERYAWRIKNTGAGLYSLGMTGKRIAIIGETSVTWFATYLGVLACGGVVIPMDKELALDQIKAFLKSVNADAIVYSGRFNGKFTDLASDNFRLIPMKPNDAEREAAPSLISIDEVKDLGRKAWADGFTFPEIENPTAMSEMLFTSGTMGSSKCVMLSQRNVFSCVTAAQKATDFGPDDVLLSVLPVHHTYELACTLAAMCYGIRICINDSLTRVLKNIQVFQPTGLVLVPLFVYTIYKKIWAEAKKGGKEKALRFALNMTHAAGAIGIDLRKKVFADVRSALGGNLVKIVCGGAALNPRMIEFFERIGVSIYEGYGITECSPLVAVAPYTYRKYGSVGPAVESCKIRIEPRSTQPNLYGYLEGEILVKGDNVMLGYYNNEEATKEAFEKGGWFRTGDMGYLDDDGYLFVTGRLKSVIVLESGKNVFPEEMEEYLGNIDEVCEAVVVGRPAEDNSDKVVLTAIVFPDYTKFEEGVSEETVMKTLTEKIHSLNTTLPSYKRIEKIELRDVEFEKTTSRKIKRNLVH